MDNIEVDQQNQLDLDEPNNNLRVSLLNRPIRGNSMKSLNDFVS